LKFLSHLAAYIFYLAVAAIITWPLLQVFSTRLVGHPFGDSYEYIRHIWWIKHALQTGQPIFFQPLLAYPHGLPGGLLWGEPLQSFPAWLFAFVMPLSAAYNLMVLLRLALNGGAMYFLVWKLTGVRGAALLSGVIFLAYPAMQGQLAAGHEGLLALWPAPLYAYALVRLRQTADRRWILAGALFFVLGILGALLLLLFVILPITVLFIVWLLAERNGAGLRRLVLTVISGGLVSAIFVLPMAADSSATPLQEGGDVTFSADLLTVVTPSFENPVFGKLVYTHTVLGEDPFETPGYVGILAASLSVVAVWRVRAARGWLALAAAAWILSLGPLLKVMARPVQIAVGEYQSFVTLPWAAVTNLPLIHFARTPSRFNLVIGLALAVMAGYGAAVLLKPRLIQLNEQAESVSKSPLHRMERGFRGEVIRWTLLALAIAFVLWEYQLFWMSGMPTVRGSVPEAIAALAQRDDVRAVFDVPWEHLLVDKEAMFLQTGHQHPLIAGHIARRTPVNPARLWLLQSTLDPALLDEAGVDIVILHKSWDDEQGMLDAFVRRRLGEPFFENGRFAAFEVPDSEAAPAFTTLVTPSGDTSAQADSYVYLPEPGWMTFSGELSASGRDVQLSLDGQLVREWTIDGETPIRVPLFTDTGYHTITLGLQPACPQYVDTALRCRGLSWNDLSLNAFTPAAPDAPVQLDRGVQLEGSHLERSAEHLNVWLWWRFDQPLTEYDVRFVHVLDADGNPVAQDDTPPGQRPAGSQWSEAVELSTDLPPGSYTVYTGWYTNPDLTRFAVHADTPGAQDGLVYLGTVDTR